MVNFKRLLKHLTMNHWQVNKAFPHQSLNAIEKAIKAGEAAYTGEIRFVVEGALDGTPLFKGQPARARAIDIFSQLRIWDTEHNNGLLVYLLLADRAVEIVADRGIHSKVGSEEWSKICRNMEAAFKQDDYERGAVKGIEAITQHLLKHFPDTNAGQNELPDKPVVM